MAVIDESFEDSAQGAPNLPPVEGLVLGYLIFGVDSSGGTTGAVMLTDYRTRPLHFGFASPVRPTAIQRLLYGPTLDEYLKVDVIGLKLLKTLPQLPQVIFVETTDALAVRRVAQLPIASLNRHAEAEQNAQQLSHLRFGVDPQSADHDVVSAIVGSLESIADLVNPFARMRDALKEAIKDAAAKSGKSS